MQIFKQLYDFKHMKYYKCKNTFIFWDYKLKSTISTKKLYFVVFDTTLKTKIKWKSKINAWQYYFNKTIYSIQMKLWIDKNKTVQAKRVVNLK